MRAPKTLSCLPIFLCTAGLLFGTLACSTSEPDESEDSDSGGQGGSAGKGGKGGGNGGSGIGGSHAGGSGGSGGHSDASGGHNAGSGGYDGGSDGGESDDDSDGVSSDGPMGGHVDAGASDGPAPVLVPAGTKKVDQHVITFYSFQDNTPVNSMFTASGRVLKQYTSVAVPRRELKSNGGFLNYGDKLWLSFLAGRTMPNGTKHSGWVQVDDFCGDGADDTYCFQQIGGVGPMYPNVDLYVGDFSKSGFMPIPPSPEKPNGDCIGPSGSGQDVTDVYTGTPAKFVTSYGGAAIGTGKCGDRQNARNQQFGPPAGAPFGDEASMKEGTLTACWGYDGQGPDTADCANCQAGTTCAK